MTKHTKNISEGYFKKNINMFRDSFKFKGLLKSLIMEFIKYLLISIICTLALILILKSLYTAYPLLNDIISLDGATQDSISEEMLEKIVSQQNIMSGLYVKLVLIYLGTLLAFNLALSYCNTVICSILSKEKFNTKKFLNVFYLYVCLGFIYTASCISILIFSNNITTILLFTIIFGLIVFYFHVLLTISIKGEKFTQTMKKSIVHSIAVSRNVLPIIIFSLFFITGLLLISLLYLVLGNYVSIIIILFILLISVWFKNYLIKNHAEYIYFIKKKD